MTRQLKWGLGALVLIILGFVALQIYLHIDMKNFRERIADRPKAEPQTPTTPNVVFSEEKPVDDPKDDPNQSIALHEVRKQETVQPMEIGTVPNPEAIVEEFKDTDRLSPEEVKTLYHILDTEGFNPDKLSQKQLLYLSKVGLHWDYLSSEQQKEVERDFHARYGLNPPPEGYEYKFQAPGEITLDVNGDAIIYKKGNRSIKKSFGGYLLNAAQ